MLFELWKGQLRGKIVKHLLDFYVHRTPASAGIPTPLPVQTGQGHSKGREKSRGEGRGQQGGQVESSEEGRVM